MVIVAVFALFRRNGKGITYTQVAQYCVLIFAIYGCLPFFISIPNGQENPIPPLGMGYNVK